MAKKAAHESSWKKNFYKAYENGNQERATEIVTSESPHLIRNGDLDGAYRHLKNNDKVTTIIQIIFLILIVLFFGWLVSKCS